MREPRREQNPAACTDDSVHQDVKIGHTLSDNTACITCFPRHYTSPTHQIQIYERRHAIPLNVIYIIGYTFVSVPRGMVD